MTVKEFYEFCEDNHITDYKIFVDQISINGCFIGYEELTPEKINISYSERMISIG